MSRKEWARLGRNFTDEWTETTTGDFLMTVRKGKREVMPRAVLSVEETKHTPVASRI